MYVLVHLERFFLAKLNFMSELLPMIITKFSFSKHFLT